MSRAARRLLGHRCTEPPMLCMTMRHEPLPRARPRGLSRRRGRRSRRRTYSQRTRGRREVAERRLRRHRQGGVSELGRCAAHFIDGLEGCVSVLHSPGDIETSGPTSHEVSAWRGREREGGGGWRTRGGEGGRGRAREGEGVARGWRVGRGTARLAAGAPANVQLV